MAEPADTRPWLALFAFLQVAQVLWWLLSAWLSFYSKFQYIGHFFIAFANVYLCQRVIGRVLVGLSWKFDQENVLSFEIVPDPFVPTRLNSNSFWIGLCFSTGFWVIVTLSLIIKGDLWAIPVLILVLICGFNLFAFMKAQKMASRQSVEAVRQVLLGKNSEFPDAVEVSNSDTDSGEKKKDEKGKGEEEHKEEEEIV